MSITTRPPATAWIGVTCTDDRLRGLHRRHYSSEKSGRRRGRPVEHPNQLRMIGPGEYLALLTLDASAGHICIQGAVGAEEKDPEEIASGILAAIADWSRSQRSLESGASS